MPDIYTFGHSARSLKEFQSVIINADIDILIDIRLKPQSRYFPHFNRKNLEEVFGVRYIFGGDFLGGSPAFHNDLLEYIETRGVQPPNSLNRLYSLINKYQRETLFSRDQRFSNNERRKAWITETYLSQYIPVENRGRALYFLTELFKKFPDKKICFFCSEKDPTHCHRYHLLEKDWLLQFPNVHVQHLEDVTGVQRPLFSSTV
jgi:uncharacterized protein (DUF488 family)